MYVTCHCHKRQKRGGTTDEQEAETAPKFNLYQVVTDRIIASLKAGVIPWEKPWKASQYTGGPFPATSAPGGRIGVSTSCSLVERLQLAILAHLQSGERAKRHRSQR